MWNSRSPGVAGARCLGPANSGNGCSPAGRRRPNSRSQTALPTPTTQVSSPSGIRKPTDRLSPLTSDSRSRTSSSAPELTVTVRKIAASVIGVRTACGSAAFVTVPYLASSSAIPPPFRTLPGGPLARAVGRLIMPVKPTLFAYRRRPRSVEHRGEEVYPPQTAEEQHAEPSLVVVARVRGPVLERRRHPARALQRHRRRAICVLEYNVVRWARASSRRRPAWLSTCAGRVGS
jgi:hypothetical protein